MIEQLKRRFVCVLMVMVSSLLFFSIVLNFVTSKLSLEEEITRMLLEIAQTEHIQNSWSLHQVALPFFAIEVHYSGQILAVWDEYYQLSQGALLEIATDISKEQKVSGTLTSYNLRYVCLDTDEGIRIVCSDISLETQMLEQLFRTSVLVGIFSLALLFLLSVKLAENLMQPVEEAWLRQQQFVADASHELKTPLTVILSSAEMLAVEECEEGNRRRWLGNISEEGQRMKRLIEDMLTLTKASDDLIQEQVELSALVERSILMFEPIAFEKSLFIVDDLEEGRFVLGDRDRLQQLLGILLDNAVKYSSEPGEVKVTLTTEQSKELLLRVDNKSIPLTELECSRVFDRFYRQDASRSTQEGYGLGLPIAREIVSVHKGEIRSFYKEGLFSMEVRLPLP